MDIFKSSLGGNHGLYRLKKVSETQFHDYVHRDDREPNDKQFYSLIQGKQEYYRKEVRYATKEGGYCWLEVLARGTVNDQGEIVGTLGTLN